MNKYLKICFPLIVLISVFLILLFQSVPSGKLWKNYTILYVPVDSNDASVITSIHNSGIKDEVALSEQYLPVNLGQHSVEISMFKINRDLPEFNYFVSRGNYFYDKSTEFRLYYIPNEYKKNLPDCLNILQNNGIKAGVDSTSSYPWLVVLISIIMAIIVGLFAKNKVPYFSAVLIPVLFIYCNPFYVSAVANSLVYLAVFQITNLWRRKGAVTYILGHYSIPSMIFVAMISVFSISFKTGFLFIIELIGISAILGTIYFIADYLRNKKSFVPVYIKPAKMMSLFAKKANIVMVSLISITVILFITFFLSSSESINSHFAKILLPSPASTQDQQLPALEDYYKWNWNIKTYPYKSLNKTNDADYYVEFPTYKNENGYISESKTIMVYNESFKDNEFSDIDNLQFNSIEKVLKSEGKNIITGYSSTSSYSTNLFGILMMLICLFVLLFIYFSIIINKIFFKRNKR